MVEPYAFTIRLLCHLRNSLRPVIPDNAWILRMTAALLLRAHAVLDFISEAYPSLWGTFLRVTQPSAARVPPKRPYRSTCMY